VLGHFVPVEHGSDFETDCGHATQRLALAGHRRGEARQFALGGGEQILAPGARSAASARLRQTIRRSPGKSGEVIAAMSRSSNSDICNAPASRKILIAGARKAVIQSRPAVLRSLAMRDWVIMPRSPTSTT
jgi:hypothetical protein